MCNVSGIIFGATNLSVREVRGKRVLEVGSLNVNGSLRPILESFGPDEYIGVDLEMGPGVDKIGDIQDLEKMFGVNTFDLVICTEVLEHVRDWRGAVHNLKQVCKKGGLLLVTTRSRGHRYHGYPADFWRYEVTDFKKIFADGEILKLEKDGQEPGVFLKYRKSRRLVEKKLDRIRLYSIVANRRIITLRSGDFWSPCFLKIRIKSRLKKIITRSVFLRKFFEICASLSQP